MIESLNEVHMVLEPSYNSQLTWSSCYQICYFFYKNVTFGATVFLYEAHASFSGQPAYNDCFLSFYNVFFTSLPVVALGVFDQDVSARLCLKVTVLFLLHLVQNVLLLQWSSMFRHFTDLVQINTEILQLQYE